MEHNGQMEVCTFLSRRFQADVCIVGCRGVVQLDGSAPQFVWGGPSKVRGL